ncbi:MAG: hypothetical protein AAF970_00150 [Bacteroidota bacterium]
MSRFIFPLSLLAVAVLVTGCVQFQTQQALYSGYAPVPAPEKPSKLTLAVEPEIFDEDGEYVWFMENPNCVQGETTSEVAATGDLAIKVAWNRGGEGCDWAGLGIGWDNWSGKDLSELLPYAAVTMQVRTQTGRLYGLPMVLTLEDYAGGMGFAYTDNKYFERSFIDEEWQAVTVPLRAFDLEVEQLDPTNVKQIMFELQQSGNMYVDDIRLIFYEEPVQEPWIVVEPPPSGTDLPITLFDDAFINNNGWGLVTDRCQSVEISDVAASSGTSALHLRWDVTQDQCYEAALGVSWTRWYPVDMTPVAENTAIQFDVRLPNGEAATELPLRVGLEDFGRQLSMARVDQSYITDAQFSPEWATVTVPFADLQGGQRILAASPATVGDLPDSAFMGQANLANIKHLVIHMDGAGEVFIDNIRLVAID